MPRQELNKRPKGKETIKLKAVLRGTTEHNNALLVGGWDEVLYFFPLGHG